MAQARPERRRNAGRVLASALVLALAAMGAARAESVYTELDLEACTLLERHPETGDVDLQCEGYDGIPVFVSDIDARMDIDFGVRNDGYQTFSMFNSVGSTIEWVLGDEGAGVTAAIIRFNLNADGRGADALTVHRIGDADGAGCLIGVVDAAQDQSNGVARGIAAMAPLFSCGSDIAVIEAPLQSPVRDINPLQTR